MLELLRIVIYYPLLNLLTLIIKFTPGHYAAVGIIVLTLLVRFILLIPSKKAAQTQRKIQQVTPLVEELKAEYGSDKQGFAVAQMDLYKKNDINPFGNCLTLLIQLPILITLYYSIRFGLSGSGEHLYPWVGRPDFINTSFFGIDLIKPDHTYVLPILAALAQYFLARFMAPQTKSVPGAKVDPAAQTQKMMMYFLPATTLIFALSFPAGVALYWVISTGFQALQQWYVNKEKYNIQGVEAALKEVDVEHPDHKKRSAKVEEVIKEETSTDKKSGVNVTVRKKKS
jgi:YidC/Oxa1 family membrane protein insertase